MKARPYQKKALREIWGALQEKDNVLLQASCSSGKCHGRGTEILLFDGSVKKIEDIKVGDQLMGPDSRPKNVLSLARGRSEMFSVFPNYNHFKPFTCNRDHILSVKYAISHDGHEKDTIENITIEDFLNADQYKKTKVWNLWKTKVHFPVFPEPEKDPYFYGLYTGSLKDGFIPDEYKLSTSKNREAFLAGLVDLKGRFSQQGRYELTYTNERLAKDVVFLASSLGVGAFCEKVDRGGKETHYKVNILFCEEDLKSPFTVTSIGMGDYYGFTLDGDGLYLLGDFTVTHNTVIFSKIIQRLLHEQPTFRALILVDREILVKQSWEKLRNVAPELTSEIGFCCAAISNKKDTSRPITIASRQSLANIVTSMKAVQLLIFDEAHLVSLPVQDRSKDQFGKIYTSLKGKNPKMRFMGCTATPYRLSQGYIYGDKNRSDCTPYFDQVDSRIYTKDLLNQGYLTPLVGYTAKNEEIEIDLQQVGKVAGEYNNGELERLMTKQIHVNSVKAAYEKYCSDRKCTLVFCTSIEHAEVVAKALGAVPIHSQNKNHINMDSKIFTSVAKLTTGVDKTGIDALIIARPTLSPSLHVQMLGRAMRLHPGKENSIIVDIVGNSNQFGLDLDNPVVKIPNVPGSGEATSKICPGQHSDGSICGAQLHASTRICPHCGHEFSKKEVEALLPELMEVKFNQPPTPQIFEVERMEVGKYISAKSGKEMIRVDFIKGSFSYKEQISLYLGFKDVYKGFFVQKSKEFWTQLAPGNAFPLSVNEAYLARNFLRKPEKIEYIQQEKFKKISKLYFPEVEMEDESLPF